MSAMIIRALKITADKIADSGVARCIIFSAFRTGNVPANMAGMMAKYLATSFSISNDVAKYFAIIPAMFSGTFPVLNALNIIHLATPESAILSAVIFNALIIIALIPLALRGVKYRPMSAESLLQRNLWIYGVGGIIVPFVGIKIIDVIIRAIGLA